MTNPPMLPVPKFSWLKRLARAMREWGPLGVSLFTLGVLVLAAALYFSAPVAYDIAVPDGPSYPPDLVDHQERGPDMPRGSVVGAAASAYPSPTFADFRFYGSPNLSARGMNPIEAITVHVTGPGTCPGMRSWFANPQARASAHYGVCKDGKIEGYVALEMAAWHNGIVNRPDLSNPLIASWVEAGVNPNLRTVGIEVLLAPGENLSDYPQMEGALLTLLRWLRDTTGVPLDRTHVIGHYQVDSVNRSVDPRCCLNLDAVVARAAEEAVAAAPQEYPYWDGERWHFEDGWSYRPDAGCGEWQDAEGRFMYGACDDAWGGRWVPAIEAWMFRGTGFYKFNRWNWVP